MLPLPTPISPLPFTPDAGPSYTQIFNDTMGAYDTPGGDMDVWLAQLAGISNAFGVELNSDPLGVSLGTAGIVLGGVNPATLDVHMSNYVASKEYGMGIVAAASGAVEPQLLTLPLTPGDGISPFVPPSQQTKDYGNVKVGSFTQRLEIGQRIVTARKGVSGTRVIGFVIPNVPTFTLLEVETDTNTGNSTITYTILMNPVLVGQFTAQFEYIAPLTGALVILTLTVNVTA
jgi:hypothetical protein